MADGFGVAYTYDGSVEGLFSAVFLAYCRRENPDDIAEECRYQPRLGQERIAVATNEEHALRVARGIRKTCGPATLDAVKAVCLSDDPCKGAVVLSFIRYAMKRGGKALYDEGHPSVRRFVALRKSVLNERHKWEQFLRFSQVEGGVYVARCQPGANVVPLLMDWFAARFNTQPFIIFDEVHSLAGVSQDGAWWLVKTDCFEPPPSTRENECFESAWKVFYDTVAVESRFNPELRRSFAPKRFWSSMTEMKDLNGLDVAQPRRNAGNGPAL